MAIHDSCSLPQTLRFPTAASSAATVRARHVIRVALEQNRPGLVKDTLPPNISFARESGHQPTWVCVPKIPWFPAAFTSLQLRVNHQKIIV